MPSKLAPKAVLDMNSRVMSEWRSRIDRGLVVFDRIIYDSNPEGYARAFYYFKQAGQSKPELGCVIEGPHEPLREAADLLGENARIVLQPQKRKAIAAAAAAEEAKLRASFPAIAEDDEEEMDEVMQASEERGKKKACPSPPRASAAAQAGPSRPKPKPTARRNARAGPSNRMAVFVNKREEYTPPPQLPQLPSAPTTDLNSLREPVVAFDDTASVASYRTNVSQVTQGEAPPSYHGLGTKLRVHSATKAVARLDIQNYEMEEDQLEDQQAIQQIVDVQMEC